MANFALMLVHGPGWDDSRPIREQDAWDGHAAFMDALVDDGFIVLGGPLSTGERTLHLVEATSEQEIRTRMSADPWASMKLLEIGSIEPWALWLDSRKPGGDALPPKVLSPKTVSLSRYGHPAPAPRLRMILAGLAKPYWPSGARLVSRNWVVRVTGRALCGLLAEHRQAEVLQSGGSAMSW